MEFVGVRVDGWLGCFSVWNCACNGLILKVGLRFEGEVESSENNYHLPTNRLPRMPQGFFIFFKCKAGQQWETVIDFTCLPRMCCALKYVLLTTISPLLSSYLPAQSFSPCAHWPYCIQYLAGSRVFVLGVCLLPWTQADLLPTMLFLWFSSAFPSAHFSSAEAAFTFDWGKTHSVVL